LKRRAFLRNCLQNSAGLISLTGIPLLSTTNVPSRKIQIKEKITVKVLGTAQDGGVPQLGCDCPNCTRARREPRHKRLIASLALLEHVSHEAFLVDASPDIRPQLETILQKGDSPLPASKNPLDGIILTHAHIGHYTGLMFFGYEALSAQKLPVFCSERMAAFLRDNGPWSQLVRLENIRLRVFSEDREIRLTPRISFQPFLVPHRDEYSDTVGIKIIGPRKKMLYIPDIQNWQAWKRDVRKEIQSVDIALLDGTFFSAAELPGRDLSKIGHPFIRSSMDLFEDVIHPKKTQVYFTHLNHSNPALDPEGPAYKEIESRGFDLATEGQEFTL